MAGVKKTMISLPDDPLVRIERARAALATIGRFESADLIRAERDQRDVGDRAR